jgi:hypothetical protein
VEVVEATQNGVGVSPRAVRALVLVVFAGGIAGMIASSIADSNGWALTFGLLTAGAALCLITVTAATGGARADDAELLGAALESRVERLVAAGADEEEVRSLVADAVRLGRARR